MRVPYNKLGKTILGIFVLTIILLIFYMIAPILFGREYNGDVVSITAIIKSILSILILLLILLAVFLISLTTSILPAIEVLTSKNRLEFKIIWTVALLILPLVGFIAYFYMGKKERL